MAMISASSQSVNVGQYRKATARQANVKAMPSRKVMNIEIVPLKKPRVSEAGVSGFGSAKTAESVNPALSLVPRLSDYLVAKSCAGS